MIRIDGALCELCGTCVGVCPVDAIIIEGTVIRIEPGRCIECLACVSICPVGAPSSGEEPSDTHSPPLTDKEPAGGIV